MKLLILLIVIIAIYICFKSSKSNRIGKQGEKEIVQAIKSCGISGNIYNNVYIKFRSGAMTEIDIAFLTDRGLYVIESKNYSGKVYGSPGDRNWTVVYRNGKKYSLYNPVLQNDGHIKALCNKIGLSNKLTKSLVVFGNDADISGVTTFTPCINTRDVVGHLKRDYRESSVRLSDREINRVNNSLKSMQNTSEIDKIKHILRIKAKYRK